jgi:hypothetical protein
LAIESFEGLFISGFEGTNVDARLSLRKFSGGCKDTMVGLGGDLELRE